MARVKHYNPETHEWEYADMASPGEKGDIGPAGPAGPAGVDGVSPTVAVTKSGRVTTVSITDKNGTQTKTILDGAAGADGRSIHYLRFNAQHENDTFVGTLVPQTGDLPFKVGDLGISKNGYLYEYTGDNDYGEHNLKYLARVVKDGVDGEDGVSATHSWNGTTLTITSASGTSSANLKGDKGDTGATGPQGPAGADGKTPVKGTDFFTAADKAEMVNAVIAALPVYAGEVV